MLEGADAAAWRALRLFMLEESPSAFSADSDAARAEPLDLIAERVARTPDHFVVGAFVDGGLVGTTGGARERNAKRRHIAVIWGMFVHPDHRRAGLARILLEHATSALFAMPGVDQIELSVTAGNDTAHRLYLRHGFIEYGREPTALRIAGRDYDEILMVARRNRGNRVEPTR